MSFVPPATRDGWSYSGELHVEASGNNRHRRATLPELRALFDGTDGLKDRPAHWYEAQLLHYGLPSSKTKGTAKMRLFDAVSKGDLAVPAHILKVEAELKKDWTKRGREAKQALRKPAAPAATTPARSSNKRKADDNQPTAIAKAARTTTKQTARRGTTSARASKSTSSRSAPAVPDVSPARRQTARRSRPFNPVGQTPSRSAPAVPENRPIPRQTARCSRPYNPRGRGPPTAARSPQPPQFDATPSHWDQPHDPPPPYPGSPYGGSQNTSYDGEDDWRGGSLPPLGLLNGRYQLRCTRPHEFADRGHDSNIVMTLDGDALWGRFEIGPLSGILRLKERPWASSDRPLYFAWRGEDELDDDHAETNDGSYIKFLGDGKIIGEIGFYEEMLEFEGYRISGQDTRSEISASSMRRKWAERGY